MILTRLTAAGGSRVTLWLDDGTKLKVSPQTVLDCGLYKGMELSEADLQTLLSATRQTSARDRAVRIVSASGVSERDLRRRLVQRGETAEDAEDAVAWLRDLGAVDDGAMAKRVVERCIAKGYGEARIRQELSAKGIPGEYWDEALEDLPAMDDAIDRFLRKRLRGRELDQRELQRAAAALQRRGHSWEDIRQALERYRAELEETEQI